MTAHNKTTLFIKNKDKRILVLHSSNVWTLPEVTEGPINLVNISLLQQAVEDQFDLKVAIGRQLFKGKDAITGINEYIYEAYILNEVSLDNVQWFTNDNFDRITFEKEEVSQILQKWFNKEEKNELCPPWFQGDYYHQIESWIHAEVERMGYKITGDISQLKATEFSLVQTVPTNGGNLYFKVAGQDSKHEAALSSYLDRKHPGKTTNIVAMNNKTGWFLMKDLGGVPLRSLKDKEIWQKAIREYAELQIVEINNANKLLELGVPYRPLTKLKADIMEHLESMCDRGLNTEEKEGVMNLQHELMAMCEELEELLPFLSIDHGDFHSANIQFVDGKVVFLDWGDSIITHPFFSTRVFWNSLYELTENDTDEEWQQMVACFRPVYLDAWADLAPMEKLKRGLDISDQLGCIHRGLSWYFSKNVDKSDLNKPAQWLQALLEEREFAKERIG